MEVAENTVNYCITEDKCMADPQCFIIHIIGDENLTVYEVNYITLLIREKLSSHENTYYFCNTSIDTSIKDEVIVTNIVTSPSRFSASECSKRTS